MRFKAIHSDVLGQSESRGVVLQTKAVLELHIVRAVARVDMYLMVIGDFLEE